MRQFDREFDFLDLAGEGPNCKPAAVTGRHVATTGPAGKMVKPIGWDVRLLGAIDERMAKGYGPRPSGL
jgi:hypothetical protein